jgi:hypothetical protein
MKVGKKAKKYRIETNKGSEAVKSKKKKRMQRLIT